MNPSIRAILFDADGVIVHPYRFRAWLERERAVTPAITARNHTQKVFARNSNWFRQIHGLKMANVIGKGYAG